MERDRRIATHEGIVKSVAEGRVEVQIEAVSACGSCAAHAHCGFAESKDKILEIPCADWQSYHEGDTVVVCIGQSRGMLAVWIAYLLPAILIIGVIVALSLARLPEGAVVAAAFATLALYILALYLLRNRIESRFTLSITHKS